MRRPRAWMLLASCLTVLSGCKGCKKKMPQMTPDEAKLKIETLLLQGDMAGARGVADQFLKTKGKTFKDAALFYGAFCRQYDPQDPQPTLAAADYRTLLNDYPDSSLREETLFQLGQCFQMDPLAPNPEHALTWYSQLLAEFPAGARAHRAAYESGLCHEALASEKSFQDAVSCYGELAKIQEAEPWATRALFRMAQIEEEHLGRYEDAVAHYDAFVQRGAPEAEGVKAVQAQVRMAMLLSNRLDRGEEGQQVLASLMSETERSDWRAVIAQKAQMQGKGSP